MSSKYLDIYYRVSTQEQKKEGNSLEVQKDLGIKVAKKLGLEPRFHNEGARSSTIQFRQVLENLKYDIREGLVKNLWVSDRSRLFRDMTDSLLFRRDYLEKHKINLYEGETPSLLDLDSPAERFTYNVLTASKQLENEERQNKSIQGKLYRLRKDAPKKPVYLGGTPLFGYKTVNKEWKINPEEAKWVRFIFDSYEKGKSTKEIKDILDREGVEPRRTKNGLWNLGTLNVMLKNRSYTGIHTQFIKRVEESFSYKIPKIINVGQFNRVQKKIAGNLKNPSNNKQHFSLLEDFLVCECGRNYGSRHLKTKSSLGYKVDTRTYHCLSKYYDWKSGDGSVCINKKSLQMDSFNKYVLDFVKDKVSKSHLLKENFKKEVMQEQFERRNNIQETERNLERKIQKLQKEIENIEDNIVELEIDKGMGVKDSNVVDKILSRYGEELENRRTLLVETEKQIDDLGQDKKWLDWVQKYGETLELNTSNEKKQKDFLHGVLEKIVVKSSYGLDRDGKKKIQNGHTIDFHFKMKIVDDSLEVEEGTKPKKYRVIEGKNTDTTSEVMKFVSKRKRVKKKQRVS